MENLRILLKGRCTQQSCKIMQNTAKLAKKTVLCIFDVFKLIARCSTVSMIFGFLGKFWVGVVKNISKKICFRDEKKFERKTKNIFRDQQISEKKLWKSHWKMKISKFRFFRKFFEISIFSFFIDFFIDFFFENFWSRKIFFRFSINFFRSFFFSTKKISTTYSD